MQYSNGHANVTLVADAHPSAAFSAYGAPPFGLFARARARLLRDRCSSSVPRQPCESAQHQQ